MINEIIRLTKASGDVERHGINLTEYREYLATKDVASLEDILSRKRYYASGRAEKDVQRLVNELDRGGMFNIGRMRPGNALD